MIIHLMVFLLNLVVVLLISIADRILILIIHLVVFNLLHSEVSIQSEAILVEQTLLYLDSVDMSLLNTFLNLFLKILSEQ